MEPNEKIYVIISGKYSDWSIVGFARTEEDAMQICAGHNTGERNGWNDWYIRDAVFMDTPSERGSDRYVYDIEFDVYNSGHTRMLIPDDDDEEIEPYKCFLVKRAPIVWERYWHSTNEKKRMIVTVQLEKEDREKAEKIAQDTLYRFLAEKKGL